MEKIIEREIYYERIKSLIGKNIIKVITGIRRCGKSTILKYIKKHLEGIYSSDLILYIDFSDIKNDFLLNYKVLHEYIIQKCQSDEKYFLLLDEVQDVLMWEKTINSLYTNGKYDIYITGSNSKMLSTELTTLLTGRYIEIEVYPFSFKEYMQYFDSTDTYQLFDEYLRYGGLPGLLQLEKKDHETYIESLLFSILEKDIKRRHIIENSIVFDKLLNYVSKNIGKQTSIKRISDTLISASIKTNQNTISTYLSYYIEAFILRYVSRYDIKGSEILNTLGKYYLMDIGLRISQTNSLYQDLGFIYENIVYIELLRRHYKVFVGKLYQNEIDFIAENSTERLYIQVSANINDEYTFNREVGPLLKIKDNYEKILIADTRQDKKNYLGIKIIDIRQWLLNE